jgi:hypothetical protein
VLKPMIKDKRKKTKKKAGNDADVVGAAAE